ncbi:MAG: transcriptional regulator [Candidatus Tectomicrobia bacterium]|nr:transcriptional regulator [Candidatus Tectomicrobia bacterium]
MAAERLSRLQRRMMQWVYEVEERSGGLYRPGYGELRRALGGNKGNMSVSLRNLEVKGLIHVYRTSGGQASTVWLTEAGQNRADKLKKVLIKR